MFTAAGPKPERAEFLVSRHEEMDLSVCVTTQVDSHLSKRSLNWDIV